MSMRNPLRILSIEDDPKDAKLIQDLLETEDIVCEVTRVDTQAALMASLKQGGIDLILADYTLPSFDGISALKLAMKACPEVPFIFVSGTLGEEVAIEALKVGATDYVLKTRLSRLAPSVVRALREATERAERKQADDKLRHSEAFLTEAQRLSQTGSFGCNLSTGEMFWSEETFRIYGYDRSTRPAVERVLQRVHPEDKRLVEEQIDRASRGGKECHVECRLLLPDSSVKHIRIVAHASQNEPEINEFIGAVMDVTAAKQAEEKLRRSEAYLAEAQKLSHTGSFGWNVNSGEIYWSPETFRIFEYEPTAKVTIGLAMQRTHPEDRSAVQQLIERVSRERTEFDLEHRLLMPDGSVKYLRVIGSPSENEDGCFEFVGAVTDITERKRGEEALRRSEAYLAESQRLTHTGSWASHATTHEALYWSEEMFRIFGFDPQQGLPMRDQWLQRMHPEDRDRVKRQASERMFVQKLDSDLEYRIVLPGGTVKHLHGLAHPVLSPNGELVEVVGTVVDITERKRAENERERLQQLQADLAHINRVSMMGELTASLAHEIKQPIFAASADAETCLRWLEREQPDLAEAQEAALRVMKDVTRASDIITCIVSLFKKGVPQRESVDVTGVIQEMIALLRSEAGRYSISIHAELTEGLPKIEADTVALQQVLMNLMLNAIEAMKEMGTPGRLTITTRQVENLQILVSVSDTGMGLPPERTEQIFNAFFTLKPQGTGMGLPISRSIIESYGGRLWATSNSGPGAGATFQFTLPLAAAARQSA
jgi:PAS domain S-box-containing protein